MQLIIGCVLWGAVIVGSAKIWWDMRESRHGILRITTQISEHLSKRHSGSTSHCAVRVVARSKGVASRTAGSEDSTDDLDQYPLRQMERRH